MRVSSKGRETLTNPEFGFFDGQVAARWLTGEGKPSREMELLERFAYTDPRGVSWVADAGRRVDGASIPQAFWSVIGSPFVGDYRRASVLHDVGCQDRLVAHRSVHQMFYEAMRCDGVGWTKAVVMFEAVRRFGPRWRLGRAFAPISRAAAPDELDVGRLVEAVESLAPEFSDTEDVDVIHRRVSEVLGAR